jgi:hypothetical protein
MEGSIMKAAVGKGKIIVGRGKGIGLPKIVGEGGATDLFILYTL